ncbi:type 1 periplasmic-binding domain-containing protein [Vineibacter terrae]|uniref:hypothetical protein n=1 Tax=Vineibacter terrae TaxID=2586908 RepID=UPI001C497F68|nr:hypothetical protein [Vineibacter terrae]
MRRREIIALLGATSVVWLRAALVQPSAKPVIGYLGATSAEVPVLRSALHAGLKESGYVEGHNVAFAYRWAERRYEQLPTLAAELVAL